MSAAFSEALFPAHGPCPWDCIRTQFPRPALECMPLAYVFPVLFLLYVSFLPSSLRTLAKSHPLVWTLPASLLVGLSVVDLGNHIAKALDLHAGERWPHRWQVPASCGHMSTLNPSFPVLRKPTVAKLNSDAGATQWAQLRVSRPPCCTEGMELQ